MCGCRSACVCMAASARVCARLCVCAQEWQVPQSSTSPLPHHGKHQGWRSSQAHPHGTMHSSAQAGARACAHIPTYTHINTHTPTPHVAACLPAGPLVEQACTRRARSTPPSAPTHHVAQHGAELAMAPAQAER